MPKISALPAAAALSGTEVAPVVQSGATVKATLQNIANLAAVAAVLVESGGGVKISGMSAAGALAGTETVPIVQGGANVKATVQSIANLAPATAAILVESGGAVKISAMSAAAALAGTETVAIVQSGATVKATLQNIANLAPAALLVESGAAAKISALSAAATLTGTESVAVVQSGATVKATAQNIANIVPTVHRYEAVGAKPAVADFTWINQLSSTATDTTTGIAVVPNIHAGDSMNILKKAAPGFPFDIYARFAWNPAAINFSEFGLLCINSSNGRLVKLTMLFDGSPFQWLVQAWPGATGSISSSSGFKTAGSPHFWLHMNVTSTVMTWSASPDGFTFTQVGTQNISTYLTAAGGSLDQVGFVFQAPQDNVHTFIGVLNVWDTSAPT